MNIHIVGIGGIGLSAIAKFLKYNGHNVSGSDLGSSSITDELLKCGIDLNIPHNKDKIFSKDLLIYSAVIKEYNQELLRAKELGIKTLHRRDALEFILKDKKVFSVCGAHGKSTTTAILSSLIDGNALIGAQSKAIGSNTRFNSSDIVIFEADESDGSFLNSNPYCSIVVNAEPEHMEYYDYDLNRFHDAYREFLLKADLRVFNAEDKFLATLKDIKALRLYPKLDIKDIRYELIDDEPFTKFKLKDLGEFSVWGIGEHIAIDASLAILAALEHKTLLEIKKDILNFRGIKKRFDIINKEKSVIIDDYGHHPTEIKATMKSLNIYKKLKGLDELITIWQPHKYSRTIDNLETFKNCFEGTAKLVILPVWAAGENEVDIDFKKEFNGYDLLLADKIQRDSHKVHILKDEEVLSSFDKDLIVGFGAGDITYQIRGLNS